MNQIKITDNIYIDASGKNEYNIATKGNVYINGKAVYDAGSRRHPYCDIFCVTDEYAFLGIHGCNPGCYPFLDRMLIIRLSDLKHREIKLWPLIGEAKYDEKSKLCSVKMRYGKVCVSSSIRKAEIYPHRIFAEDLRPGTTVSPKYNGTLASCFDYKVLEDYGILIKLKDTLTPLDLLEFHGFNADYDIFKLWDLGAGTSFLLFTDSQTRKSWTVSWGNSTSMVGNDIWERRDGLLDAIKKVFPNHPAYREELYGKVIQ